jgi:hypothetical protein
MSFTEIAKRETSDCGGRHFFGARDTATLHESAMQIFWRILVTVLMKKERRDRRLIYTSILRLRSEHMLVLRRCFGCVRLLSNMLLEFRQSRGREDMLEVIAVLYVQAVSCVGICRF